MIIGTDPANIYDRPSHYDNGTKVKIDFVADHDKESAKYLNISGYVIGVNSPPADYSMIGVMFDNKGKNIKYFPYWYMIGIQYE
jgi:hypothetical protein